MHQRRLPTPATTVTAAAVVLALGACGSDGPDFDRIEGTWSSDTPFIANPCDSPRITIDDSTVRVQFGQTYTLVCYRLRSVHQAGDDYTLQMDKVASIGENVFNEDYRPSAIEVEAKCKDPPQEPSFGNSPITLKLRVMAGGLQVLSSTLEVFDFNGSELTSYTRACRSAPSAA